MYIALYTQNSETTHPYCGTILKNTAYRTTNYFRNEILPVFVIFGVSNYFFIIAFVSALVNLQKETLEYIENIPFVLKVTR